MQGLRITQFVDPASITRLMMIMLFSLPDLPSVQAAVPGSRHIRCTQPPLLWKQGWYFHRFGEAPGWLRSVSHPSGTAYNPPPSYARGAGGSGSVSAAAGQIPAKSQECIIVFSGITAQRPDTAGPCPGAGGPAAPPPPAPPLPRFFPGPGISDTVPLQSCAAGRGR